MIQTGSGAHPASYPVGTGDSLLGVKRLGHEADQSPPTGAEVKKKKCGSIHTLPHIIFNSKIWVWKVQIKNTKNFRTLYYTQIYNIQDMCNSITNFVSGKYKKVLTFLLH
jgi:hypothetical protein